MNTNETMTPDPAAQTAEIMALLREGDWDGDDVVAGVRGLIAYSELERLRSYDLRAEVDRWRSIADQLALMLREPYPRESYVKWRKTGDSGAADRLNAYEEQRCAALARYREATT